MYLAVITITTTAIIIVVVIMRNKPPNFLLFMKFIYFFSSSNIYSILMQKYKFTPNLIYNSSLLYRISKVFLEIISCLLTLGVFKSIALLWTFSWMVQAICLVFLMSRFLFQGFMTHIYSVMLYFSTCYTGIVINNRANYLKSF